MLLPEQITFICRWIKALRSGDYRQGREILLQKSLDTSYELCYCAIAVAADLKVQEHPETWRWQERKRPLSVSYAIEEHHKDESKTVIVSDEFSLPVMMKDGLGLGQIPNIGSADICVWNDDGHMSFPAIAGEIEQRIIAYLILYKDSYSIESKETMVVALEEAGCEVVELIRKWLCLSKPQ